MEDYPVLNSVEVVPNAKFVEKRAEQEGFVFTYRIRIKNLGAEKVRLLERYWEILDINGVANRVQGSGVVGKQPDLVPGEVFIYESFTIIKNKLGCMKGKYLMQNLETSEKFYAPIPIFELIHPSVTLN